MATEDINIKDRIDQHLKFFEIMERIRWQFTSAFGVVTLVGLFLSFTGGKTEIETLIVCSILVLIISIAAIIVQIRVVDFIL